jgi:hypothetical protein
VTQRTWLPHSWSLVHAGVAFVSSENGTPFQLAVLLIGMFQIYGARAPQGPRQPTWGGNRATIPHVQSPLPTPAHSRPAIDAATASCDAVVLVVVKYAEYSTYGKTKHENFTTKRKRRKGTSLSYLRCRWWETRSRGRPTAWCGRVEKEGVAGPRSRARRIYWNRCMCAQSHRFFPLAPAPCPALTSGLAAI